MLLQSSTYDLSGDLEDPRSSGPGQDCSSQGLRITAWLFVGWVDSGSGHGCGPAWALRHYLLPHLN